MPLPLLGSTPSLDTISGQVTQKYASTVARIGDKMWPKNSSTGAFHCHRRPLVSTSTVGPLSIPSPVRGLPFWAIPLLHRRQKGCCWSHQSRHCTATIAGSVGPVYGRYICKPIQIHDHILLPHDLIGSELTRTVIMKPDHLRDLPMTLIETGLVCATYIPAHLEMSRSLCTPPGLVQYFFFELIQNYSIQPIIILKII